MVCIALKRLLKPTTDMLQRMRLCINWNVSTISLQMPYFDMVMDKYQYISLSKTFPCFLYKNSQGWGLNKYNISNEKS